MRNAFYCRMIGSAVFLAAIAILATWALLPPAHPEHESLWTVGPDLRCKISNQQIVELWNSEFSSPLTETNKIQRPSSGVDVRLAGFVPQGGGGTPFECPSDVCDGTEVTGKPFNVSCDGSCTGECQQPRSAEVCGLNGWCTAYECTDVEKNRCCANECFWTDAWCFLCRAPQSCQ